MHNFTLVISRFRYAQKNFLFSLLLLTIAVTSSLSTAGKTLIVLSADSPPYIEAAIACEKQLNANGVLTERILLEDLKSERVKQIDDPVISIGGRASAKLAHELPRSVSLYYCMVARPKKIGLIQRPNTSGISTELDIQTRIAMIQNGMSSAKKIGLLYRSSSPTSSQRIEKLRLAFPSNWKIIAIDLDKQKSASTGIKKLFKKKIDLVWTDPDTAVFNSATIKSLLLESLREKTPVFGFSHALVRAGATFGTRISPTNQGKRIASLMLENLPSPTHHSAKPELVINLIAADRIKIRFNATFIQSANRVFE